MTETTVRAYHAKAGTMIPFPEHPSPRDVIAKYLSHGLNLWTDWYPEADAILAALDKAGIRLVGEDEVVLPVRVVEQADTVLFLAERASRAQNINHVRRIIAKALAAAHPDGDSGDD